MREQLTQIVTYANENKLTANDTAMLVLLYLEDGASLSLNGNGWFDDDEEANSFFNTGDRTKKHPYEHFVKIFPEFRRLSEEEQKEKHAEWLKDNKDLLDAIGKIEDII